MEDYKPVSFKTIGFATMGLASATYSATAGVDITNTVAAAAAGAAIAYAAKSAVKDLKDGRPERRAPMIYAALLQHKFAH